MELVLYLQIRYKHTNSHTNLKTNVSVLTLPIEDSLENCGRFVDKNGSLDINHVGAQVLGQLKFPKCD